jgi:oligopeptide transport system substrate-binding protein
MYQVVEKLAIDVAVARQAIEFARNMVRRGALFGCAAVMTACGSPPDTDHRPSVSPPSHQGAEFDVRTLKRGLSGEPKTLDPHLADDNYSFQVIRDLYEGLTAEDSHGGIVPGVAASWTIDATGRIYKFQLRREAKWSDGSQIVAEEFVRGLRHAVDPSTASGSATILTIIKGASEIIAGRKEVADLGITALSESTVQIELEHPAPFVLEILSQPIAAPIHSIKNVASDIRQGDQAAATNGPYILVTRVPGSFIDLKRNIQYWDSANVLVRNVRYVIAESAATELREYSAGQLDMTFTVPTPDLERISTQRPLELQTAPFLGTLYLALNLSKAPIKNNTDLRQALSMAIDRELIAEKVMMGVTPAYALVANGTTGYSAPEYDWSVWTRDRRLAYAKALFTKAGYSESTPLHLKLYFNRDEGIQRLMVAIAGSWKQNLGVDSELASDEFRVFLAGRKDRGRWDVARLGWTADFNDPISFLEVFARSNIQNDPGYTSKAFNDSIDKAEVEPSQEKRKALLRHSEEILLNDYPIIPIYFYEARRLVKPYVGGAELTPMNRTYSRHLFWKGEK